MLFEYAKASRDLSVILFFDFSIELLRLSDYKLLALGDDVSRITPLSEIEQSYKFNTLMFLEY